MSSIHSHDRVSLCTFTFADGRRCRTPRQSGDPHFCYFHARRESQARASEEATRDITRLLSGGYLSACDLSLALGRVFAAVAQGHIKPRQARTLAYLGQVLVQAVRLSQMEFIDTFGAPTWHRITATRFNDFLSSRSPAQSSAPSHAPAPPPQTTAQTSAPQSPTPPRPSSQLCAPPQPAADNPTPIQNSSASASTTPPSTLTSSEAPPSRLPSRPSEFAAKVFGFAKPFPRRHAFRFDPSSVEDPSADSPDPLAPLESTHLQPQQNRPL